MREQLHRVVWEFYDTKEFKRIRITRVRGIGLLARASGAKRVVSGLAGRGRLTLSMDGSVDSPSGLPRSDSSTLAPAASSVVVHNSVIQSCNNLLTAYCNSLFNLSYFP